MTRPVCIITGASSGIGYGLATRFFESGYEVIVIARRLEKMEKWIAEIPNAADHIHPYQCDVSQRDSVKKVSEEIKNTFKTIDCLILNAGVSQTCAVSNFDSEIIESSIQTNLLGGTRFLTEFLPVFIAQKRGQIVAISSLAAYRGLPGHSAYCAAKSALTAVFDSIRSELRIYPNITVTTIHPGFIKTPLTDKNSFKMPFLISFDRGVNRIFKAITAKKEIVAFPFILAFGARLSRLLPVRIFNWILRNHHIKKHD